MEDSKCLGKTESLKYLFEKLHKDHQDKLRRLGIKNQAEPQKNLRLPKPKPRGNSVALVNNPFLNSQAINKPAPQNSKKSEVEKPALRSRPVPPHLQQSQTLPATPPPDNDEKWRINFEDLELEEVVSGGEAGAVYLGYYFGTPVAIKKLFIDPSQSYLMESEYCMLKDLHHPNIVQFLGLCIHESGIYLVTEYVENGDLFDLLIFAQIRVSWRDKVKIATQVAQACYYLHSKNIMHRDLKGLNILLGENFKVKLCDLGLACEVSPKGRRTTICGTDQWMAPEVLKGEPYDFKADVFSYGIVLTEIITQRPPKSRSFAQGFGLDVESFTAFVPPECPPDFAQLAIDCANTDPNDRPSFKAIIPRLRNIALSIDHDN